MKKNEQLNEDLDEKYSTFEELERENNNQREEKMLLDKNSEEPKKKVSFGDFLWLMVRVGGGYRFGDPEITTKRDKARAGFKIGNALAKGPYFLIQFLKVLWSNVAASWNIVMAVHITTLVVTLAVLPFRAVYEFFGLLIALLDKETSLTKNDKKKHVVLQALLLAWRKREAILRGFNILWCVVGIIAVPILLGFGLFSIAGLALAITLFLLGFEREIHHFIAFIELTSAKNALSSTLQTVNDFNAEELKQECEKIKELLQSIEQEKRISFKYTVQTQEQTNAIKLINNFLSNVSACTQQEAQKQKDNLDKILAWKKQQIADYETIMLELNNLVYQEEFSKDEKNCDKIRQIQQYLLLAEEKLDALKSQASSLQNAIHAIPNLNIKTAAEWKTNLIATLADHDGLQPKLAAVKSKRSTSFASLMAYIFFIMSATCTLGAAIAVVAGVPIVVTTGGAAALPIAPVLFVFGVGTAAFGALGLLTLGIVNVVAGIKGIRNTYQQTKNVLRLEDKLTEKNKKKEMIKSTVTKKAIEERSAAMRLVLGQNLRVTLIENTQNWRISFNKYVVTEDDFILFDPDKQGSIGIEGDLSKDLTKIFESHSWSGSMEKFGKWRDETVKRIKKNVLYGEDGTLHPQLAREMRSRLNRHKKLDYDIYKNAGGIWQFHEELDGAINGLIEKFFKKQAVTEQDKKFLENRIQMLKFLSPPEKWMLGKLIYHLNKRKDKHKNNEILQRSLKGIVDAIQQQLDSKAAGTRKLEETISILVADTDSFLKDKKDEKELINESINNIWNVICERYDMFLIEVEQHIKNTISINEKNKKIRNQCESAATICERAKESLVELKKIKIHTSETLKDVGKLFNDIKLLEGVYDADPVLSDNEDVKKNKEWLGDGWYKTFVANINKKVNKKIPNSSLDNEKINIESLNNNNLNNEINKNFI